jgi:hypothetical protein
MYLLSLFIFYHLIKIKSTYYIIKKINLLNSIGVIIQIIDFSYFFKMHLINII